MSSSRALLLLLFCPLLEVGVTELPFIWSMNRGLHYSGIRPDRPTPGRTGVTRVGF